MFTYPQALDAMQKIAVDMLRAASPSQKFNVEVIPDSVSGTASVTWAHDAYTAAMDVCIRMPVLPATYVMSEPEFKNYSGLTFHEVGHPLFTDKATWDRACRLGHARLLNALEDVRIEKALIDAGIAANGRQALTDLCYSLDYTALQAGFDANEPAKIGFVMGFLGRAANGYALDTGLIKLNPKGAVAKALVWALPELAACQSTADCLALAQKLIKALNKAQKPGKGPAPQKGAGEPQKGSGEPQEGKGEKGTGEPQKGSGEPQEGKGEKGKGEPQKGAGEPQEGEGEKGKGAGEGGREGGAQGEGGEGNGKPRKPFTDADIDEVDLRPKPAQAELKNRGYDRAADTEKKVISLIRAAGKPLNVAAPKATAHVGAYQQTRIEQKAAEASRHRARLASALKRNEDDLYEGGLKHGRLDSRAFAKLATGSRHVMSRREAIDGYETDCVVLVDGSSSMQEGNGTSKIEAAATLALVIAQACAQVGVNCSTYQFGAGYSSNRGSHGLIEVGERGRPDASLFAGMVESAGGGTPLCESLLYVAGKQAARAQTKRRVVFIVSDGMCGQGPAPLKAVAAYVESALGTELANLSIGEPLQGCFSNEAYVNPRADIAAAGLEQLIRKLTQDASQ